MHEMDEVFTALPLQLLADAALTHARRLGCEHADVRIERTSSSQRSLRDARLESASDHVDLGIGIRVIHEGSWGFASGVLLTTAAAQQLVERAVALAQISRPLSTHRVELAPEPVHQGSWISAYTLNPYEVADAERVGRLSELSEKLHSHPAVTHVSATVDWTQANKFYADLSGTATMQQLVRIDPSLTATNVSEQGFATMRTIAPPAGRGWEYLTGSGWDFDDEIAQMGELLAEKVAAPSGEPGRYDLVIDPSNLWLTIHESVAHGTELDRALGYEAAYAGSSFARYEDRGSLAYGSSVMNVTGDRVTDHGLATVAWDDEGVAAQSFDIIRDGVLVDFQLNRQMAQEKGYARSNGCAFADAASNIPMQRMPNVSLQPDPVGPDTAELIARVDHGLYIVGDNSWSIDMQRYNFQFTGQRFFRIKNGKLAGQVTDVAYQATTTDFWGSMEAVGGPQTWLLAGAVNCGKGQPGQSAPVSHGSPVALFREVNVLSTREEQK
ncbi:MAG: TldD/PmbA family protein [Propionibacteriaceae bacterium]